MKLKNFSLKARLLLFFLLVGIIPFAVVSITALMESQEALEEQAYNQLVSVRNIKKSQIEAFFEEREADIEMLVETVGSLEDEATDKLAAVQDLRSKQIRELINDMRTDATYLARSQDALHSFNLLKQYHDESGATADGPLNVSSPEYEDLYPRVDEVLGEYVRSFGYYDVFLICAKHGHVLYTAARESDLGANVGHGSLKSEGLGRLWRRTVSTGNTTIEDFSAYSPSGGKQAAFVGAPVKDETGAVVAVVALQLPHGKINTIVQSRSGMGRTGETYVIGRQDGVTALRSDMKTMGNGTHVIGYQVTTPYAERALQGQSGTGIFTDSAGKLTLVSYGPLDIEGVNWAAVSKVELEEVIAPERDGSAVDYYAKYIEEYNYYDLFLIHPEGECFYSVCREADYGSNLVSGEFSDSGLGKLVREVLETKQYGFADFAPYAPSGGEPAAFIGRPVIKRGSVKFVVALQLSLDAINDIMTQREGMGETGETYLVGADKRMRSDSFLDQEGRSVAASFAGNVKNNGADTEAVREALAGLSDAKIITDYNGSPVLSAYTPVEVGDTTWALLAEIDKAEAFAAVHALQWLIGIVACVGVGAIVLVALMVANSIAKPLNRTIAGLSAGAEQTTSAASQVSSSSQSLAQGATEQASSLEEITSSIEEMASQTKQNTSSANEAKSLADSARDSADKGATAMQRMSSAIDDIKNASDETAKIVSTIDEIAFQTNLLALNAAVEAARAGEAGKGFAVVAEEVRNLAQRSADAARTTAEKIEGSVKNADNGVTISKEVGEVLGEIVTGVRKVSELVAEITAASNEQSQGIDQISTAVGQMDQVTQSAAANAEESASSAEELSAQAEELHRMVQELTSIVGGSSAGAQQQHAGGGTSHQSGGQERSRGPRSGPRPEREMPGGVDAPQRRRLNKKKTHADAEELIPMEEEELASF